MLYKDWQYPNTYLVSLKQLKQKQWILSQLSLFYNHNNPNASNSILPPRGNCHSSFGAKCFDITCPLWSLEDLMSRTVESCKGHLGLHSLHYCGCFVCEVSVCLKRPLGWNTVPTPSTPYSPHPTILMARPAVFLCCVMTGLRPLGGPPPNLYPHAPVPGSISFSLLAPSRIGWNIPLWSPVSLSSLCGLWGPSHSLALRFSLYHVLFFSLVAFYSFKFFSLFAIRRLCLALSLFYHFLRSPQAPQWDPCFPSQRCLSALLSSSIPADGKSWRQSALFINSFIYLVRAEVVPACISLYLRV